MAIVIKALECVLTLFVIGMVGYVLSRRGWFSPETNAMLPRLVTVITLPPYLFYNIVATFDRDQLSHLIYGAIVPMVSILITYVISLMFRRLGRVGGRRRGIFSTSFAGSNTMFIGLPVNIALFGEESLPYILLYFFANTLFFWTIGNYSMSHDGQAEHAPLFSLTTVKQVFSPPFLGFLAGLIVVWTGLPVFGFIMESARYIGGITTPLAIIFIGITLSTVKLRAYNIDRDVVMVLLGRFIISPLIIFILLIFIDLPPLMAKVFFIQASLPVGTSVAILASYYRSDAEYGSLVVSLSTLLSVFTIPAFMVIISALVH